MYKNRINKKVVKNQILRNLYKQFQKNLNQHQYMYYETDDNDYIKKLILLNEDNKKIKSAACITVSEKNMDNIYICFLTTNNDLDILYKRIINSKEVVNKDFRFNLKEKTKTVAQVNFLLNRKAPGNMRDRISLFNYLITTN